MVHITSPAAKQQTIDDELTPAIWLGSDLTMADIQPQVAQQPCFCLVERS
jgi:hypothetical protein